MKYTYEHHDAADSYKAHYEYTDELGRKMRSWGLPGSGTHLYYVKDGQDTCDAQEWYESLPIGQRGSSWLSDARTVLSRAETALAYVVKGKHATEITDGDVNELSAPNEDKDIIDSLRAVIHELDWVRKTGRTPKYPGAKK